MEPNNVTSNHIAQVEDSAGFLLWQVAMCWQRNINKVLEEFELTYTQYVVLSVTKWLQQENAQVYQHQIAKHARIDRMMTSRILASLERKKYLKRIKQSDDARTNIVTLTNTGEYKILNALKVVNEQQNLFFDASNKADTEFVKNLLSILVRC